MKNILILTIFILSGCGISNEERVLVDQFYTQEIQKQTLYMHGSQGKLKNLDKIKYVTINSEKVDCYTTSKWNWACRYPTTFKNSKGQEGTLSITVHENDYKKGKLNISTWNFYKKDPLKGLYKHKKWINKVKDEKIVIGMPEEMLYLSWGYPQSENNSVGSWGIHKQLIYPKHYVYLENGKISSWQSKTKINGRYY